MKINLVTVPLLINALIGIIVVLVFAGKFIKMLPRIRELDKRYPKALVARSFVPFSQSWKANVESSDIQTFLRLRRMLFFMLLILLVLRVAGRAWLFVQTGYWR